MNKQQLAAKIWQSANKMRSKIEANEYKDYILGFIFYKFLSDKLEKFALEQGLEKSNFANELTESNGELVNHIKRNLGYFISYEHLFSTWLAQGSDFNIANVRTAMSAFSRNIAENYISVFDGIFKTLESGLSKLGDTAASQTNAVKDLFVLIADIPMDGKQGYDVLGFIYEYLISMFAANAGKKAGEFYTPHEVSLLMSEIIADHLKDREEISIYDPTSGSGSLLINIGHSVAKHLKSADSIKYYAQELKENTYNLTRMNLVMRGILPSNIFTRNADTLEDDWPLEGEPLYLDAVVSNPPYSQPWNPKDKEGDIRYKRFGVAPQAKADFAFLLHDLFHLKPDGIMTIVLPHGVLFRGGEEEKIRKNLIEYNHIDAIIGLPANIFFGTGIPTIIVVLRQERERNDILMIDASKHFIKVGKNNHLQASDIKRIVDCVTHRQELPKFSRIVPKAEIVANGYNLNIPRYVDSAEPAEQWDIFATMHGGIPKAELAQFADYWAAFDGLQTALFTDNGTPYVQPKTDNLKAAMQSHASVLNYQAQFAQNFADFTASLEILLIEPMETLNISQTQQQLAELIRRQYPEATAIAGVATGAIAQGALVADELGLPMCYVRAKAKDHGMGNLIEGTLPEGARIVVVEDLISTGGSSLKAVEALRAAGFEILGMVASFTYGFPVAAEAFAAANVELTTLTNYEAVVETACRVGYIDESQLPLLARWRANPSTWTPEA